MKKLNPLPGNHSEFFDDLVDAKTGELKDRLLLLKPSIHRRFKTYQDRFEQDTLAGISSWDITAVQQDDLEGCYDTKMQLRNALVASIRSNQPRALRGTCQYCGIGRPNSIDHYLPKTDYPEYSIFALNLVPCCTECNSKKGIFWKSNGERAIINFYKDPIPSRKFLSATIDYDPIDDVPMAVFNADFSVIANSKVRRRIEQHFERLELLDRYQERAFTQIENTRISLISYFTEKSLSKIKLALLREGRNLRSQYGINHWKAALAEGLARSQRFLGGIADEI